MAENNQTQPVQSAPVQAPAASPMPNLSIEDVREAQRRGLLDQFRPEQKARMLQMLEPEMEKERQQALQPPAQVAAQDPEQKTFVGRVMSTLSPAWEQPMAAAANVVKGVARAYNPLPLVNLAGKINPLTNAKIPDDLETLQALVKFPIIRGSELAARMFMPADQRPSLTTYTQVVDDQRQLDAELRKLAPGFQEAAELAAGAAGAKALVTDGLNIVKAISRRAPEAAKAANMWFAEQRAASAANKAKDLGRQLLREGDGPILDAVLNRPENVKAIIDGKSDVTMNDVAVELKDQLLNIGRKLGEKVGKYRDAAFADTKTRMDVPDNVQPLIDTLRSRTTLNGESQLPRDIERRLQSAETIAKFGVTNPNQAMVLVDTIDDIIDFGGSGKPGSNAVKNANITLMQLRRSIKDMLRQHNTQSASEAYPMEQYVRTGPTTSAAAKQMRNEIAFKLWADADDNLHGFLNESDGLIRRLESDSSESLVANLFNNNKTPLRNRLESALDYMGRIDPSAQGHGDAFFSRLADVKAADAVKRVKLQISDRDQDNMNRIVQQWTKRGEEVGQAVGFSMLGGAGAMMGGSAPMSGIAGGIGLLGGRVAGREVARAIGERMANPDRVLNFATKAKNLSQDARSLANDMLFMNNKFGPESSIAFLDLVGPIPAVNELIKFSNTIQGKGESNARGN